MYFLLEYFKTVAFGWMFLEGFYLHNQLVLTVFNSEPRLTPYLLAGYGIPLLHTLIWLFVVLVKKDFKVERCLGSYYLEPEFWILDGPRMAELVVNLFFICNVIRVLWSKVRESHSTSELDKMKKSVKAALMLIPLLGIPNIMQTIPFAPTRDNITIFAIWTYLASFTYMYQGLMITIIYCFTNKEVTLTMDNNNGASLSPYTQRSKKGSGDSTAKLMLSVPHCADELVNNNGYGAASERTPLKTQCDCSDELRFIPIRKSCDQHLLIQTGSGSAGSVVKSCHYGWHLLSTLSSPKLGYTARHQLLECTAATRGRRIHRTFSDTFTSSHS
ncbi:7 transmembrane receptor [Teladorsagia circumcincta]|uniref:7 transmembrane receptor n=1 Tax=Teladorsagia circumcincta TaxID=45464 RepID=A0A2G9UUF3_TELCI|nr:7 transmembrane receptor [Teladorsagia circumcincta]